jgi:hypothetical protein
VRQDIIDTADDCRTLAAEFMEQANRDPERKGHLLEMAARWLDIADRADQIEFLMDGARSSAR